jgi:hypothetical protein
MPDLLLQAMDARLRKNDAKAKQLLAQALIQDPHNEGAWMMMSEVVDDVKLKRNCLQRVLLINPQNSAASIALMKLDTSPLSPVVRGERYKPVVPPKIGKAPPFTPPFTWSGDEAQFQALGDMTYPDLTGDEVNQPPETPTTFDWASDSAEPDKTIGKIFDAVSNPERAVEPLPDSDLSWLDNPLAAGAAAGAAATGSSTGAVSGEALAGSFAEASNGQPPFTDSGFMVSTDPQIGVADNEADNLTQAGLNEPDPLLWDNPKSKTERMVILGSKSIIYANPAESDVPHILGLFKEKKMLRDLLGENAGTIKLESIHRLTVNPKKSNIDIEYTLDEKPAIHQLIFASPNERDEAWDALQLRLGGGFTRTTHKFSLVDKILAPLLIVVLVAVLGWFLLGGLSYLAGVPAFQSGVLQLILVNIQYYVDLIGPQIILMIAVVLVVLCLIWLLINLSKPSNLVILEQK